MGNSSTSLREIPAVTREPRTPYRARDLHAYLAVRLVTEAAATAQSIAVGWTLYKLSNTPLALGIVGIVQFLPMLLLTLPAGELCDRMSPRRVMSAGLGVQALCALWLAVLTTTLAGTSVWPFYLVVLAFGAARAFVEPASQALVPFLVPAEQLPRAIALSSSAWQVAIIAGPALGGVAYTFGATVAYAICGAGFVVGMLGVMAVGGRRPRAAKVASRAERVARVREGLAFVWSRPVVLGAVSLDLFAVLFGGATALLPVYARDILRVGPAGLGLLRSAPAVGACVSALVQARYPARKHIGSRLFSAVAVFGGATIVFALSTSLLVSLAALLVVGASDMVSVNIRSVLVQGDTPDSMRGRVAAVSMLFIGASGELGAFESGLAASMLGAVPAVVIGGIATLLVAAVWKRAFPALAGAGHAGESHAVEH